MTSNPCSVRLRLLHKLSRAATQYSRAALDLSASIGLPKGEYDSRPDWRLTWKPQMRHRIRYRPLRVLMNPKPPEKWGNFIGCRASIARFLRSGYWGRPVRRAAMPLARGRDW